MQNAANRPTGVDKLSSGSGGGLSKMKLGVIILAPIAVCLIVVTQFLLPQYVNKVDDAKNIAGLSDAVNKSKADVAQAIASMQTTLGALPTTVAGQINSGVTQATSSVNSKIDSMQSQITNMAAAVTASTNKLASVDALSAKVVADEAANAAFTANLTKQVADLTANVTGQNAIQDQRVAELKALVLALQSQQNLNNVTVTSVSSNISFANTVYSTVGVQIANTGTTATTVNLQLLLTTATSGIVISGIDMNRVFTYSLSNPNVTFYTTVTIEASSSVTLNPQVRLTYTGTSPNIWNVAWSRQ